MIVMTRRQARAEGLRKVRPDRIGAINSRAWVIDTEEGFLGYDGYVDDCRFAITFENKDEAMEAAHEWGFHYFVILRVLATTYGRIQAPFSLEEIVDDCIDESVHADNYDSMDAADIRKDAYVTTYNRVFLHEGNQS